MNVIAAIEEDAEIHVKKPQIGSEFLTERV
jgi:hypothetical protein